MRALDSLFEQIEDPDNDPVLIADHYFEDYAREMAEDVGAISRAEAWPLNCIDWARAVRDLKMDYTSIEFDGQAYWRHA